MSTVYKINEIFYSLKGEGQWTGCPMHFIRLSGCNLKCPFCDTEDKLTWEMTAGEITHYLERSKTHDRMCRRVVITGGEPTMQDLSDLIIELRKNYFQVHLETNGCFDIPVISLIDWIALSPKRFMMSEMVVGAADEIKFLVGGEGWLTAMNSILDAYPMKGRLYLMPIAKNWKEGDRSKDDIIQENLNTALQYCKRNPQFSLCMQMHKVWGIP